ncbi:hypothetical protein C8R48DRAFT_701626 [Suillus tomentosus]|nr:hypothetical protein C8R48DRAFT_701626 [Suillus tomentosus]
MGLAEKSDRTRLAEKLGRTGLATDSGRAGLAAESCRMGLAADSCRMGLAADPSRTELAADQGRTRLAADQGRTRLAEVSGRARLAEIPRRAGLAADVPWSSVEIHSCGVRLGDFGRILKYVGSNHPVCHCPRIMFATNLSSGSAVQKLAGLLNVPSVPCVKPPASFHCIINISFTKQEDRSCYERLHDFHTQGTAHQSIIFRYSQVRLSKLGHTSLACSRSTG